MAEEILEETQTEGTTEITPETPSEGTTEGTQTEGTTEGTQTEGTTGNGYLTKPYLVRNLQTFWGKIKQYIKNQRFVNEDIIKGALLSKADQSELDSLEDIVNGKAEASDLEDLKTTVDGKVSQTELTERLAGKVDAVEGKGLSKNDFTDVLKTKLDQLTSDVVTSSNPGLMSADDKQKLDSIAREATKVTVDSEWNPNSENPAQSKVISAELANKVDKEADPSDPSELIRLNSITSYATDEGHIVLNFIGDTEHLKIYAPNSGRPIEKVSLKDEGNILFTNFQENDDGTLAITIENPEGKDGDTWNINEYTSFNFYIESLTVDSTKYKPFILEAVRGDESNLIKIELSILKIF